MNMRKIEYVDVSNWSKKDTEAYLNQLSGRNKSTRSSWWLVLAEGLSGLLLFWK